MTARADQAARLLADPVLAEAFQSVREAILRKIEECPIRDTEGAERARLMLKLLRDVRGNLELAIQDGKVEQLRLEEAQRFSIVRR